MTTYQIKDEPEWVIGGSKPPAELLWNILSAEKALEIASAMLELLPPMWEEDAELLGEYADKVRELQGK